MMTRRKLIIIRLIKNEHGILNTLLNIDLPPEKPYFPLNMGGSMKIHKVFRLQIGFLAVLLFIWRADPTTLSFIIGGCIMALGECVRFVSAGTLIKFEGVTRTGIYSCIRNPLYAGSFILGAGGCVMGRDPVFAALFLILFPLVYRGVIRGEETWLIGRYGDDYRRYLEEVPRIFPRRLDLREIFRETSPFLAVKNRELGAIGGMALVMAIMAVKMAM